MTPVYDAPPTPRKPRLSLSHLPIAKVQIVSMVPGEGIRAVNVFARGWIVRQPENTVQ